MQIKGEISLQVLHVKHNCYTNNTLNVVTNVWSCMEEFNLNLFNRYVQHVREQVCNFSMDSTVIEDIYMSTVYAYLCIILH